METTNQEYERYQKASKKVKEIKGFYSHLTVYILVISILTFINLKYTPEYIWVIWSAAGWGIGLLGHASKAYDWVPFFGKDWEEKKIKEFMKEENQQKDKFQ